jgi:5'-methylthioadenosine nucleosidase
MDKSEIKNVIIAIAMQDEASPFVNHLGLEQDTDFFPKETPFKAFRGKHNTCDLTVVTNGQDSVYGTGVENVGTVPAALATFLALQKNKGETDLLINAGTCGGFKAKGAAVGDVFITTGVAKHDRRIPIPPYVPYGIGKLPCFKADKLADSLNAKMGICTTGNSLDKHDVDEKIMKENDASVKDMEAAAIAWSCALYDTPHFGVKVVTDIVDGDQPTQDEFLENLSSAAKSLQTTLPKVIDFICGKEHDEL